MDLTHLPLSVLESILEFCSTDDKINVLCCNGTYRTVMQPIVWTNSTIAVYISELTAFLPDGTFEFFEYVTSNFNVGANVGRLLSKVCPTKLKRFEFDGSFDSDNRDFDILDCILNKCVHVQYLSLSNLELYDWSAVFLKGHTLTTLVIAFSNISDEFFKALPAQNELKEVDLLKCNKITEVGLAALVSSSPNIKSLQLRESGEDGIVEWDLACLDMLVNLEYLVLDNIAIQNASFTHICGHLKDLRTLKLKNLNIPKDVMGYVDSLPNLTDLDIAYCNDIRTNFFTKLIHVPLRRICFSYELFRGVASQNLRRHLKALNDIATLSNLIITLPTLDDVSYYAKLNEVLMTMYNHPENGWTLISVSLHRWTLQRKTKGLAN